MSLKCNHEDLLHCQWRVSQETVVVNEDYIAKDRKLEDAKIMSSEHLAFTDMEAGFWVGNFMVF